MGREPEGVRSASASTIEIDFYYQGTRCRERLKLKPTTSNLKRAARHRAAVIAAIEDGTFDYSVTFPASKNAHKFIRSDRLDNYLAQWLEHKRPTLKASSYRTYKTIVERLIVPKLGHLLLPEVSRPKVRDWLSGLTVGNKRMSNIQTVLRSALTDAVHDDLLQTNPLHGWHYRRNEAPANTGPDPFTREEQSAILGALRPESRPLIQFAFWTGMRPSEYIALEWGDIDWQRMEIHVTKSITAAARGEIEDTKTNAGRRVISLLPPAAEALKQQKAATFMHPSGRIFLWPRSQKPFSGDTDIREKIWRPALLRAGVRYRRLYQARHTFGSMMLSAGEPLAWVSRQMGHRDVVFTARTYARWIPNDSPELGMRAVEMFGQHSQDSVSNDA
ncbi:site-specific integrase [Kushneria phosphatilytica]|uniref:Site-specific integrase n=1 Tax=Kushneria phosphatilytica TaxID=657387 RepID=A0A1S1P0K4_9GAMM|nr:site-specific integrase [Kushneria phosphatilytica]OHV12968.1 site-specific integrase [Kushneria phosphatilytica]QEL10836.1 site-specific integrase [Kushneria phosphatilytica]